MEKLRAALYCHADCRLSPETAERELQRQQELLESYANARCIELTASYIHVGQADLDLNDPVLLHMLQDAKRKDFDVVLLEQFALFPACSDNDIPPICLLSAAENKQLTIGRSSAPLFDEVAEAPSGAVVYLRDGSDVSFWNSPLFN